MQASERVGKAKGLPFPDSLPFGVTAAAQVRLGPGQIPDGAQACAGGAAGIRGLLPRGRFAASIVWQGQAAAADLRVTLLRGVPPEKACKSMTKHEKHDNFVEGCWRG